MRFTVAELAARVGATVEGVGDREITNVASLADAGPSDLGFAVGRWLKQLPGSKAGAVILAEGRAPDGMAVLRHPHPRAAFARIAAWMYPPVRPESGVHPRAEVHPSAVVEGACIEAFAVIEAGAVVGAGTWVQAHAYVGRRAQIGRDGRLMPHATVLEDCVLGDRVVLKPGAVVGADGFGHVIDGGGVLKVPQLGRAVVGDDVEIGANACVDRAALGETRIGEGTRLDNLVQIAHGVRIGARCLLAAFSGVAGGARLGDEVLMGGRAAVVDGVSVGSRSMLAALSSAQRDVPAGSQLGGSPARPFREWLRTTAALRRLPELVRELDRKKRREEDDE
jgi:UDP-3-O-[3-hydroxymyristoyl] glucosamine N-acyltransferase